MQKSYSFFSALHLHLALLLLFASGKQAAAANEEPLKALLIYGNGGIATWGQNFNEYFRGHLGPELGQYFTPEFVALVSAEPDEYELIARSLALKYSNSKIDLLIPVLPESNSFVHQWSHVFAPEARILHVLPGADVHTDPESLGPNEAVIASAITTAVDATARLMPVILPELKTVYVVGGAGDGDRSYMQRYRQTLSALDSPLEFRYLNGLPMDELLRELQAADANSAVMMTTYDMDRNGLPYRTLMVVQELSENLDIPVFGNTDTLPANGALGGSITSAASYARAAYDVTQQLIAGEAVSGFASVETDNLFNGAQLDRFNIDRSLLPPGSEIIQEPFNFWRDYGLWIWIATAVMAVQFLLIGLLWAARQRSRKAEAKLRDASKMEALGVLAGGVAHDFNNILMAISANTELATMQLGDDEKVREKLARIESASDRAEHLVGQILLFSRQSRQQERQAIQLCKLMDDSVDHIRQIMPPGCRIKLQCELPGVVLQADANQLHQVVMNLCINAQHAMDNHGVVEVQVEYSKLEAQQNFLDQTIPAGNYITLRIADSGSGIKAEDLKHIFEPFYTTKPSGKGTGLGLALVYQIVKAHNGYIDVRSEPGQGTEVTVYLHPSDETPNHNATAPGIMLQGNNERLLLVDDDYMVLDANRQSLETLGYQVIAFSSSVAALQYAEDNPGDIDLLITDLSMPEMDGVRLINNIRLATPGLPCILCTGYLDALNTLNSPDLDDIQIIKKPFSMPEISSALKKALQQSASTEPA